MLFVQVDKIKNFIGAQIQVDISSPLDVAAYGYDDFSFAAPVAFFGSAQKLPQGINIVGQATARILTPCSLCGEMCESAVCVEIDALYSELGEKPDLNGERDIHPFTGDTIDLAPEVLGQIFLQLPMRLLCKEDCRGLCPVCGANLNKQKCSCQEDDIDPRLERLKEFLFDGSKKGV